MYTAIFQLLALAVGVAAAPTTACNKDNCLRAISASAFPTRLGAQDCSSYFLATVTPATITYTHTYLVFTTATFPHTIIRTTVEIDTSIGTSTRTSTSDINITNTATEVDTTTQTITTISPADVTTTIFPEKGKRIVAGRQVTINPSSIPSYASACSGSVRYSSACSCLGVTGSTITLSAPTTTTVITATGAETILSPTTTTSTSTDLLVFSVGFVVTSSVTETTTVTTTTDVATTTYVTVAPTQTTDDTTSV